MNSKLLIVQAALALTLTGCGGSSGGDAGTIPEVATGGDNGSFTLPPSVLSQLGTDLQAEEISVARVESIFTPQNDALLLTSGVTGFSISF